MAILVWIAAVREENPISTRLYSQRITLNVDSLADNIIISNMADIPTEIQVSLTGPESSWATLSPRSFQAWIDLSDYETGEYNVPIQIDTADPQMEVEEIFPPEVMVRLEPLSVKEMSAVVRINGQPPGGFTYRLPSEPITVTIKGPAGFVSEVDRVEGQLTLNNVRDNVERNVRFFPRSSTNETVPDVTVDPSSETITVTVEQKFGYNNVRVKAEVLGEPAPGYFISSITAEPNEIVLIGPDEAPSLVETRDVDISGATEDVIKRVPLNLPRGFTVEPEAGQDAETSRSVLVTVGISAFSSARTIERRILPEGAAEDLSVQMEPETVQIILAGPSPILDNLAEDDLVIFVDLFDLRPGVYQLEPSVIKPEELEVSSIIPDIVQVTIRPESAATPTPRSIPTVTPTSTVTSTDLVTFSSGPAVDEMEMSVADGSEILDRD